MRIEILCRVLLFWPAMHLASCEDPKTADLPKPSAADHSVAAPVAPPPAQTPTTAPTIVAEKVEDTWVFFDHEVSTAEVKKADAQALHVGLASSQDGCLVIGDAVVIWKPAHRDLVRQLVRQLRTGDPVSVTVSGGGVSRAEGATDGAFPREITSRCRTNALWIAGAGGPSWKNEGA